MLNAVFSISSSRVARAELMSMVVNVSVLSIIMELLDGRRILRWKADSICDSIW